MCTSSATDDLSLPEWMLAPDCPDWAKSKQYADLDAVTAIEIRRGFVDQRTVNQRLSNRKYQSKRRALRPPSVPVDRKLTKLKAHVSMWRNHIARAEAYPPGSIEAARAVFSLQSYRARLKDAEGALSKYVESALRAELARHE